MRRPKHFGPVPSSAVFSLDRLAILVVIAMTVACGWCRGKHARADFPFEDAPIHYGRKASNDRVARLAIRMASGEVTLKRSDIGQFLPDLLKELDVPLSSQTLVFSKTSLQLNQIGPSRPRAIYFNDDTYVAWVQNGYMIEIGSMDDHDGAIFYSLRLDGGPARLSRDRGGCLACHASTRTQRVPGFFIRSVYPREDGRPRDTGTITNHQSPFEGRWGGWYVTGTHGSMRHLGNELATDPEVVEKVDIDRGANVTSLEGRFDLGPYLTPHSDIVALLVLEHQIQMHNLITYAHYETLKAIDQEQSSLAEDTANRDEVATQKLDRIAAAGEKLLSYMFFAGEASLTAPISGTSGFAEEFAAKGPFDSSGRSLRQFNLTTRLFEYPCSYLIYSSGFDALPPAMTDYLRQRITEILAGKDNSETYSHLTPEIRAAIREILTATKSEFLTGDLSR